MTAQLAAEHTTEARAESILEDYQMTAATLAGAIAVLPVRAEGALSITLQVRTTGAHFRITPARDPQQPRLWCVAVRQCSSSGVVETAGPIWIDRPGRSQADLAGIIDSIRSDIEDWLATPSRRDLCRWLLTAAPSPTPAQAAGLAAHPGQQQ